MQLPTHVQQLSDAFVRELDATLGDRFVGMFQYGAVCFPPSPISDYDAHVIISEPLTDAVRDEVRAMWKRLEAYPLGDDMDVWYVTQDAMRRADRPQTEMRPGFFDMHWALHRAHWHAGRFIRVVGPDPRELVPEPTWEEIDACLQDELAEREEHLDDMGAYGVLNLCRVLYSYENHDVVTGKLQAAVWAMATIDVSHHRLVRSAVDGYATESYTVDGDTQAFYEMMRERIARARALS